MKFVRISSGVALSAFAAAALAQAAADTDGDGLISSYEYQQWAMQRFNELDADGDDFLNEDERRRGRQAASRRGRSGPRFFEQADADGDGRVSLAEANALGDRATSLFERADEDADGYLTREELASTFAAAGAERAKRMAAADTDGDNALSLSELQAVRPDLTAEQFARFDSNGDGLLTQDERPIRRRPTR